MTLVKVKSCEVKLGGEVRFGECSVESRLFYCYERFVGKAGKTTLVRLTVKHDTRGVGRVTLFVETCNSVVRRNSHDTVGREGEKTIEISRKGGVTYFFMSICRAFLGTEENRCTLMSIST